MLRCWILLLAILVLCARLGCAEGEALPEFADRRIGVDELKQEDDRFSFATLCESDEDGSQIEAVAIGPDGSAAVYAGGNIFVHAFDGRFLYGCRVKFSNEHYRDRLFYSQSGKLCYPASYTAEEGTRLVVLVFADDLSAIEACYRLDAERELESCARFVPRQFEGIPGQIYMTAHPDSAYLVNSVTPARLVLQYRNTRQTFVAYDHQAEYEQEIEARRPLKYVARAGVFLAVCLAIGGEILKKRRKLEDKA